MRKTMCFLLALAGMLALAFVTREAVMRDTERHFDVVSDYRLYHEGSGDGAEQAVSDYSLDLHGGIVIDADAGFEHRSFYVREWNGHAAVFNWLGSLCHETGVVVEGVDTAVRKIIEKGIYFNTLDSARCFIESL